jgi:pullulanase/glycogen debranching enzyme
VCSETASPDIHLNWAAWVGLDEGIVTFTRDWPANSKPGLWWGEDRLELKHLRRAQAPSFGLHAGYYGRKRKIVFVFPRHLAGEVDLHDGLFLAGSFNGWEAAIGDSRWRLQPQEVGGESCYILEVSRRKMPAEEATFKFVSAHGHWFEVPEQAPNPHFDGLGNRNYLFHPGRTGRHRFLFKTPLPLQQSGGRKLYFEGPEGVESVRLNPGIFLKSLGTEAFLGAKVGVETTLFHFFAPRARRVFLHLYENPDGPEGEPVVMEYTDDLVWEASVPGNRHGWFYHYTVEGEEGDEVGYFDASFRIPDPYAMAMAGPRGPGIVVEDAFFEREPDGFTAPHWHDMVIAEAHVRDLTAHAPVAMEDGERLEFTGLQKWAQAEGFYLKQLGVNAVELQPVHQFDTMEKETYGWGYMPVNFFSPASQYARDPAALDQVRQFRELVRCLHERGFAVILDVVYNHVGEPNFLQYIDMEYYFLLTEDGHYQNYSGCGNTLDAETPMVRRLIRDSLVHWIQAYGVDGFRFDLGELLGKETLAWLEQELKAVHPPVVLIAEPWSFRGHIARDLRETGFASWNDNYREFVRDYLLLKEDASGLGYHLLGSAPEWSRFPAQTVNYLASHDDRCWIDKITQNGHHDGTRPTADDRRRTHLMAALLMISLGIPMLAAGEDFMKSKGGVNNTYLDGERNAIPYERAAEYSGTAAFVRGWIRFRLSSRGRLLRLAAFPEDGYFEVFAEGPLFALLINADRSGGPERLLFVVNPDYASREARFDGEDLSAFRQLADTERWGDPFLERPLFARGSDFLRVPALSCGLFLEG